MPVLELTLDPHGRFNLPAGPCRFSNRTTLMQTHVLC